MSNNDVQCLFFTGIIYLVAVDKFISKSNDIHNNYYDYSLVEYISPDNKVVIVCPIHGQFQQTPNSHINKKCGCPKCGYIKRAQNNLIKYGVDNVFKVTHIQQKQQHTKLLKHGDPYYTNRDKAVETMLNTYGIDNFFRGKNYQSTIKKNNNIKYGCHPSQLNIVDVLPLLTNYDWLFDEYITKRKSINLISKELKVSIQGVCNYLHFHDIPVTYTVGFSKISIIWLEMIMEQCQIHIQHMLNSSTGEYKIPYKNEGSNKQLYMKVDGFCEATNTVYEFHGDRFHGNPKIFQLDELCHPFTDVPAGELYRETVEKEERIKNLGYNLIVMWEYDFDKC